MAAAEKTTEEKQLKEIETALKPAVVALSKYVDEDGEQFAPKEEGPEPKLQNEASSLYHQVKTFLGHLRAHEMIQESEKASA